MFKKPLLIAGVDPGTTTAIALLRLDKRVYFISSTRNLGLDKLIQKTMESGHVIVVGTDKANVPDLVEKFSTRLGARLKFPKEDLLISEKKTLVGSIKTNNSHELDALASALFAYKEIQPLLRRIQVFLRLHKREDLFEPLSEVCIKQELAISLAFDLITNQKKEETKTIKSILREDSVSRQRVMELYEALSKSQEDLVFLSEQNAKLRRELELQRLKGEDFKSRLGYSVQEKFRKTLSGMANEKHSLAVNANRLEAQLSTLRKELAQYETILGALNRFVVMKRLANLGAAEFDRKVNLLNISNHDIVLVDNPSITSDKVIDKVRFLELVVVSKQELSRKQQLILGVTVVLASLLKITETTLFAFCEKSQLEGLLHEKGALQRIVKDYQDSRK